MLVVGTVISVGLGIISGVIAAWRRSTWLDASNLWTALSFYAMPTQSIGLLVIFYIAIPLGLPAAGICRTPSDCSARVAVDDDLGQG